LEQALAISTSQLSLPLESAPQDHSVDGIFEQKRVVGNSSKPFLKWAGGKTRLLDRIVPYVPVVFENYHEPFLGGGAMFFAVGHRAQQHAHLADLNQELVNAWLAVQLHREELRAALQHYAENDSKEFYLSVRPLEPEGVVARAARFIYLNQTSWNGLWRVNKRGEFNVPWGDRQFRGLSDARLLELAGALGRATIHFEDFRDALRRPERGDFVYLDPPYLPISDTSKFHLYTERRFRKPDLTELASLCRQLSARGVLWVLSNRDTPLVRELFRDASIHSLTVQRSVAAQNARDVEARESPEVIIVGEVNHERS
jgi:DNA adenine methylase